MNNTAMVLDDDVFASVWVEPAHVLGMNPDGFILKRGHDVGICHPDLGWGRVDVMNERDFRVWFESAVVWFSLRDERVAAWPLENAAEFCRWAARVKAVL